MKIYDLSNLGFDPRLKQTLFKKLGSGWSCLFFNSVVTISNKIGVAVHHERYLVRLTRVTDFTQSSGCFLDKSLRIPRSQENKENFRAFPVYKEIPIFLSP